MHTHVHRAALPMFRTCVAAMLPLHAAHAQEFVRPESLPQGFVIVVDDKSGLATPDSPIYLASNHVGWNPGDASMRLTPLDDGRWQIALGKPRDPSRLEFKFTRGTWGTVEVAEDLSDISNRMLAAIDASTISSDERPTIRLTIEHFADERPTGPAGDANDPDRPIDAVGDIRRLEVGGGGAGELIRQVLVWLPPGYDDAENADRQYPVLYLQDGQNVFEQLPGVPGEWRADETAQELITLGGVEPLIIVAIPHAGRLRAQEYLPVPAFGVTEPGGDAYVEFLVGEVMPRVESSFRVSTERERTAIGGSSLGAVISLHAARRHPERFGMLLLESTALLRDLDRSPVWDMLRSMDRRPDRVYIGVGGHEAGTGEDAAELNAAYLAASRRLDALFAEAGLPDHARKLVIDESATHTEEAWARRFPKALIFLFPAR